MKSFLLTCIFFLSSNLFASESNGLVSKFIEAIKAGDKKEVEECIDQGCDLNLVTKGEGNTPLFIAILYEHVEIVELLLSRGALTSVRGSHGRPPLFLAAQLKLIEIVKLLLRHGANPNAIVMNELIPGWEEFLSHHSKTPLMIASEDGCVGVVKALLLNGASYHLAMVPRLTEVLQETPGSFLARERAFAIMAVRDGFLARRLGADITTHLGGFVEQLGVQGVHFYRERIQRTIEEQNLAI